MGSIYELIIDRILIDKSKVRIMIVDFHFENYSTRIFQLL